MLGRRERTPRAPDCVRERLLLAQRSTKLYLRAGKAQVESSGLSIHDEPAIGTAPWGNGSTRAYRWISVALKETAKDGPTDSAS